MRKPPFNANKILEEARAGQLTSSALRKAIKRAEELNLGKVAKELELYLVSPSAFAGDAAPEQIRERVAQGISALSAMGHSLSRTRPMFRRHGVIETLNRIAKYTAASRNFEKLRDAGLLHLTAEAIVLDYPELFSPDAVTVAKSRLS